MRVSVNYPWGNDRDARGVVRESCGWDFGTAPTGWGYPPDRPGGRWRPYWRVNLANDLRIFAGLRISTVRMAIMFNGLTYGTGPDVPVSIGRDWDFVPPPLSAAFIADFRDLVTTFGAFRRPDGHPVVQLLPCLFGFELAADPFFDVAPPHRLPAWTDFHDGPGGVGGTHYVSGRRAAALRLTPLMTDATRTYQESFLDHVVDGLLGDFDPGGPLYAHRDVIHSVDLCGEPEAFALAPFDNPGYVPLPDTIALLNDGIARIRRHGLQPTVGFRTMTPYTDPDWSRIAPHIGQFHYYNGEVLPYVHGPAPAIIGEAATTADSPFDPRVARLFATPGSRGRPVVPLAMRLEWFERLRYQEVFLWSAGRGAPTEWHTWTENEARQVEAFTRGDRRFTRQVAEAASVRLA